MPVQMEGCAATRMRRGVLTQACGRAYCKVEDEGVRLASDGDREDRLTHVVIVRHDQLGGLIPLQLVVGHHSCVGEMCRRADGAYDGIV